MFVPCAFLGISGFLVWYGWSHKQKGVLYLGLLIGAVFVCGLLGSLR